MKKVSNLFYVLILLLIISCVNMSPKDASRQVDSTKVDYIKSTITNVYEGEAGHDIFYDTKEKKGILFISDNNFQFTILDITDNNQWIIVEKTPAIAQEGRVETEHLLFNIQKNKEINISIIDSTLSPYVIRFEKKEGVEYVVTSTKFNESEVLLSLKSLLPIITLKFGKKDDQIGQGVTEKKVNDGDYMFAIPCITACDGKIYVVDAINFRIMVFDYDGNYLRNINYPRKSGNHKWNVVKDICVDKDNVYLLSNSDKSIYVIDIHKEDVIFNITGKDTESKKFGSINRIALDAKGNLLVPDTWDNSLYTYHRVGNEFKMISKQPYLGDDQLISDVEGLSYKIRSDSSKVVITNSTGKNIGNYSYTLSTGGSTILGVDDNQNIYIRTFESDTPEAQFTQASYVKVISQSGVILNNFKVTPWSGGPITRDVAIDRNGNIFLASFDSPSAKSLDAPPTEFIIRMICK